MTNDKIYRSDLLMPLIYMRKIIPIWFLLVLTSLLFISCNNSRHDSVENQKDSLITETEKKLSSFLADFENQNETPNLHFGGFIYAFTDQSETPKGTSTINELKRNAKNNDKSLILIPVHEKGKGACNSDGFLRISGKITTAFPYGFVGCGVSFTTDKRGLDISKFKGVKFWARGNGVNFVVRLESPIIKDFAYHGCEFFADKDWEEFIIPFEDFRQPSWKAKMVNLKDVLKSVCSIQWETNNRPMDNYFLCLDNIEFIK
jgi:hypothetical protein